MGACLPFAEGDLHATSSGWSQHPSVGLTQRRIAREMNQLSRSEKRSIKNQVPEQRLRNGELDLAINVHLFPIGVVSLPKFRGQLV